MKRRKNQAKTGFFGLYPNADLGFFPEKSSLNKYSYEQTEHTMVNARTYVCLVHARTKQTSEQTRGMFIYIYERSKCRYVKLNTLNILHVHGPRSNAPLNLTGKYAPRLSYVH